MSPLTLGNVSPVLARHISTTFALQIADPQYPDYGGIVYPEWGLAAASNATSFITGCGFLYLAHIGPQHYTLDLDPAELLAKASLAAEYLLHVQRPSGLIDPRDCNYDSGPDTGFSVQMLCTLIELGRPRAQLDPNLAALLNQVERFIRRAVPGMCAGGFHTPNHRWVIASALAQAGQLFTDLDIRPVLEAYLAEGFDLDVEGAFNERSSGIYDAVSDRSLLGPGADAHRMWAMRDAEPAPHHVRVLMTFVAPIDYRFSIRVWHGLESAANGHSFQRSSGRT